MNELSSLGVILLLALLAGHLVQVLRFPEVTGYILAGIALGPSVLGWVSSENLQALSVLSEVALGLILFSIGGVFEYRLFRRFGRRIVRLAMTESLLASLLVASAMIALGQPWELALLLGAIAIETAPASTLMVIRECHGKGPVSDTMLGLIAVNNIFCLAAYSLAAALIKLTAGWAGWSNVASSLYQSLFPLVWQLAGSAALGFLVGLMLAGWAGQVAERGEMLILLAGSILLCVGVAQIFELSSLIASLSVGATMANLSPSSRKIFQALGGTDPPFYAIFFVIAGADLDVAAIPEMGLLGAGYVCARGTGKFVGARVGTRLLKMDPNVQKYLGFGLMAQAGLAVGLMMTTEQQFPQYAATIKTVILSSVTIFEMFGPISARFAIVRAGEARIRRPDTGSIWALE